MALGFHYAGCHITLLDSDLENAKKIVAVIKEDGGQELFCK